MSMQLPGGLDHMEAKTLPMISVVVGYKYTIHDIHSEIRSNCLLGIWAGTIGTQRLLKMFAKYDIKCTWFIPGHSLDTFPEEMAAVRDAGHEIGLHGYLHENPVDMSLEQQEAVLDKTYKQLTEFAGKPPRGSVAPW